MMHYKDLTENEKVLFEHIEAMFVNHPSITRQQFVSVLGVMINKYKKSQVCV